MTTTNTNQSATNSKAALDDNLSKVFAMICSKACPDRMAAVRSLLNLHREPAQRCPEGLSFDSRTVSEHIVEMAPEAADFVMQEIVAKYYVKDPAAVQMSIRQQWANLNYSKDGVQKGADLRHAKGRRRQPIQANTTSNTKGSPMKQTSQPYSPTGRSECSTNTECTEMPLESKRN